MMRERNSCPRRRSARCASLRAAAPPRSVQRTQTLPEVKLSASVVLLLQVFAASAHPQCLDFQPPFKPQWHLEFCAQYEQFGCCDQRTDNTIAERYWNIIELLEAAGQDLCEDMLKEVMCQVSLQSTPRLTLVLS